ncbi:Uncharacterised protein [Leminorella richardii]|uniref:Uncharacterized protein n=2 Tax=Leminorella richardii TaxID=158841 RepID=A0A2X4V5Q4_9GAMM|nr:Uncharacterised protein [Leminorella richardii]
MHTVRYGEKEMRLIESGALDEQAPLLAGKDLDVKKKRSSGARPLSRSLVWLLPTPPTGDLPDA